MDYKELLSDRHEGDINSQQKSPDRELQPKGEKGIVSSSETRKEIQTDRRRWLALGIAWTCIFFMSVAWITFSPIADMMACYYDVDIVWINSLAWIDVVAYILGFVPSAWFLNKFGLKTTTTVAGGIIGVAAWLRFAGVGW